jgi:hypothetical protein
MTLGGGTRDLLDFSIRRLGRKVWALEGMS